VNSENRTHSGEDSEHRRWRSRAGAMSGEGMLERGVRSRVGHLKGTGRGRKGRRTAGEARMQEKGKKVCAEEVEERYPRERRQSQVSAVPASSLPTEPDPLLSFKVQRSDGRPASLRQSQPDQIPSKSKSPSPTASDTSSSPGTKRPLSIPRPFPSLLETSPEPKPPHAAPYPDVGYPKPKIHIITHTSL
jgi:hypothetical protein